MNNDVKWGPWVGWNGGYDHPYGNEVIEIFQANGTRSVTKPKNLDWHHPDNSEWSVIAYRVQKQQKRETVTRHHECYIVTYDTLDGAPQWDTLKAVAL